ncbi:MAG: large-conductance mechanosensitive channel protein MscL [Clostridia bacterium]|nr:large-conductance mechanosensitive channel protein MscL [Clostridia bacterium]
MKKFIDEFKAFIAKGNVVDMAVAVIIGGAFGKIVTSLVNDVIMPLISIIVGGLNVTDWKWVIKEAVYAADGTLQTAETALFYGNFIQTIIDFLIIALCIFVMLKLILGIQSKFKKAEEVVEEAIEEQTETEIDILKEIRDALKEKTNA